jgi:hypothetical protein
MREPAAAALQSTRTQWDSKSIIVHGLISSTTRERLLARLGGTAPCNTTEALQGSLTAREGHAAIAEGQGRRAAKRRRKRGGTQRRNRAGHCGSHHC